MTEAKRAAPKRNKFIQLRPETIYDQILRRIRREENGDRYCIIYLEMLMFAVKTDGVIDSSGLYENFSEDIADKIHEDPQDVKMTVDLLRKIKVVQVNRERIQLLEHNKYIGCEAESTARVRRFRLKNQGGNQDG